MTASYVPRFGTYSAYGGRVAPYVPLRGSRYVNPYVGAGAGLYRSGLAGSMLGAGYAGAGYAGAGLYRSSYVPRMSFVPPVTTVVPPVTTTTEETTEVEGE